MPSAPSIIADRDKSINARHFPWHSRYLKSCRLIAVLSSEVIVIDGNHLLCFIKLHGCTTQSATVFL